MRRGGALAAARLRRWGSAAGDEAVERKLLHTVRRILADLRPLAIDDVGVYQALRDRAMTFDRPGTFDVSVCAAPTLPRLEPAVEVAAYRTVAEAMSNAAHHAQARRCEVQVRGDGDLVVIDVVDDGLRLQAGSTSTGLGLRSMRARVESVGGRLRIDGVEPHGTRVSASFPVHRERDAP